MWSRREQGRLQLSGSGLPRGSLCDRPETDKQRAEEVDADANGDYAVVGSATVYEGRWNSGKQGWNVNNEMIM